MSDLLERINSALVRLARPLRVGLAGLVVGISACEVAKIGDSGGCDTVHDFSRVWISQGSMTREVRQDPPPLSFIIGQEYRDLGVMAEQMTAEWQAIADSAAKSIDAQEKTRSAFYQMIASEHREMFGETARLIGAVSTYGDIPLVVLAAGKPNPAFGEVAEEYQRYWVEQSRTLTDKSANGKFILAEGASHHLYLDVPELVAESILSVVYEVRAK